MKDLILQSMNPREKRRVAKSFGGVKNNGESLYKTMAKKKCQLAHQKNRNVFGQKINVRQDKLDMHFRETKRRDALHSEPVQTRNLVVNNEQRNQLTPLFEPSMVERRKFNITNQLLTCPDPSFSMLEERDINHRAEAYAVSTLPDCNFYVLPESVCNSQPALQNLSCAGDLRNGYDTKEIAKRKRKSYNNFDCFVTSARREEIDGSLPPGTKLLKPPRKLVELVAEAIDKSPDGMLQVQQIYTVLQNNFPYFSFMDKSAINSWRSSIRHALYQKWFRKIRFITEGISAKGCFWAINRSLSPNEWIIPYPENVSLCNKKKKSRSATSFLDLLLEPNVEEDEQLKDVIQIAKEYGISFPECVADAKNELLLLKKLNVPSPVKDPDPILVACVPSKAEQTPKRENRQFDIDEGFEELPFTRTPRVVSSLKDLTYEEQMTCAPCLITWISPCVDELPQLFSPAFSSHPYGMPVFPDHSDY